MLNSLLIALRHASGSILQLHLGLRAQRHCLLQERTHMSAFVLMCTREYRSNICNAKANYVKVDGQSITRMRPLLSNSQRHAAEGPHVLTSGAL